MNNFKDHKALSSYYKEYSGQDSTEDTEIRTFAV